MDNRDYRISIDTSSSAGEAFARINEVRAWWTKGFAGETQRIGDTFSVRWGDTFVNFEVAELVPEKKIVWNVVDSGLPWLKDKQEWTGTKVIWELAQGEKATRINMIHLGLVPQVECYETCEAGWNFFVGESLYRLLKENIGMPDRENR